jgi:hypothetical protein
VGRRQVSMRLRRDCQGDFAALPRRTRPRRWVARVHPEMGVAGMILTPSP